MLRGDDAGHLRGNSDLVVYLAQDASLVLLEASKGVFGAVYWMGDVL